MKEVVEDVMVKKHLFCTKQETVESKILRGSDKSGSGSGLKTAIKVSQLQEEQSTINASNKQAFQEIFTPSKQVRFFRPFAKSREHSKKGLAVIIMTSNSSGPPRAVLVTTDLLMDHA
ncbi:hypothetical protein AV530_010945 [Patagioenas fasciata monilis]|uniref:Uncharacterized protein n=1 Tax=Patagioenas fasciata monilis TaxID=372326 RepID=A0A1V4K8I0_PATFA|nr:hypothetical protein AV530_010945 [Patagioenas fasciata monilis]